MTPQLQQAIRLLQLSALDLRQEIQEAIEVNPLLELDEDYGADTDPNAETSEEPSQQDAELDMDASDNLPDDLGVDTEWDDVYETAAPAGSAPVDAEGEGWEARSAAPVSLQEHMLWQLNLTPMTSVDRAIGFAIIESLDERGYLLSSLADLAEAACRELEEAVPEDGIEEDEVLAVLHLVQQFDPPGVACADLQECLLIQLRQLAEDTPWRDIAIKLVQEYLALLEGRDLNGLKRKLGLSDEDLTEVMHLIRNLHPAPGLTLQQEESEYVVPDVILSRRGKRWQVELNPDSLPRVRLNGQYAAMAGTTSRDDDAKYLKAQLQEARWFLKSLQSRNETLLKVATRIVEVQQGFFDFGEEAMKPLVLADIAEAVSMHESTISRVTSQKYMLTPRGVFELKYFFSSHVGTDAGGECSSTAIRAIIKKLIAAEDPRKPLSDNKLADLLNDQGIQVARRTVAKYREAMRIPSSSDRKRVI